MTDYHREKRERESERERETQKHAERKRKRERKTGRASSERERENTINESKTVRARESRSLMYCRERAMISVVYVHAFNLLELNVIQYSSTSIVD